MKKLSILVPQYKETDEVIKPLLDSIQMQINVDFNDIEVVICRDGTDTLLNYHNFGKYSFYIKYYIDREENKGVSFTRNELLDYAEGEYIMYCDADDSFFNIMGLFIIMQDIEKGFDVFSSAFIEELRVGNKPAFAVKQDNRVFVHGKVIRKQFLIDKGIRWNNKLKMHEDFYFFAQCFCMTDQIRYCPEPFYIWRWNKNSVTRKSKDFFFATYTKVIDEHTELLKVLIKKGYKDAAIWYLQNFVYSFCNMMNEERWQNKYKAKTIKRFAKYWKKFSDIFIYDEKNAEAHKVDRIHFNAFIKQLKQINDEVKYKIK